MTREQKIIYLAGFIDGEGSIFITTRKPRIEKENNYQYSVQHYLYLVVVNTNPKPIKLLKEVFGGRIYSLRGTSCGWRPTWRWETVCKKAESIIRELLPYLIVKKEEAELALEFRKECKKPLGQIRVKKLKKEIIDKREKYKKSMQELKQQTYIM